MARGIDRLREWGHVSLAEVGAKLPGRRLTDAEIEEWAERLASAVRGRKTAASIGNAMALAVEAFLSRYGG